MLILNTEKEFKSESQPGDSRSNRHAHETLNHNFRDQRKALKKSI